MELILFLCLMDDLLEDVHMSLTLCHDRVESLGATPVFCNAREQKKCSN